ncbi:hypothetical protein BJ138DRAFT_1147773 [Hygrophoropsis aurantiaca]|uniref:Uncharacterized protein n=1 Tax=Hygrophoropsis aurantiaca TaxID=72124 RepID=A0ACB8AHR4_9AGAM|nr:hypothetical protein BJ138DRAFT_1147773 [Hygrophoropsis aurantiaca]
MPQNNDTIGNSSAGSYISALGSPLSLTRDQEYTFPSTFSFPNSPEPPSPSPSIPQPLPQLRIPSLRLEYESSIATTPNLAFDEQTVDDSTYDATHEIDEFCDSIRISEQNMPATILPELISPSRLSDIRNTDAIKASAAYSLSHPSPSNENTTNLRQSDGQYSAAAKGKRKVYSEGLPPFIKLTHDGEDGIERSSPVPRCSQSATGWVTHNKPILQDYANRQISPSLGERVNVSLNHPSQFIAGALQLLTNRDSDDSDTGRPQLGPQLLENFIDIHRWAEEYIRVRLGMSTQDIGENVPLLLVIITNNFYEAHMHLIDRICEAAVRNRDSRRSVSLDIEDFALGFDFTMSQDMPFLVESSSRIRDTLEQCRPRSPIEIDIPPPQNPVTRSGRTSKMSKQAQAAAQEKHEKQTKARQRGREKQKKLAEELELKQNEKDSEMTPAQLQKQVRGQAQVTPGPPQDIKPLSLGGAVLCTPSAVVYHTPSHGVMLQSPPSNPPETEHAVCPTCGRDMPLEPAGDMSSRASVPAAHISPISLPSNSQRRAPRKTSTSNLSLPPLNAPSVVPTNSGSSAISAHANLRPQRKASPTSSRSVAPSITNNTIGPTQTRSLKIKLPLLIPGMHARASNSSVPDTVDPQDTIGTGTRSTSAALRGRRGRGRGTGRVTAKANVRKIKFDDSDAHGDAFTTQEASSQPTPILERDVGMSTSNNLPGVILRSPSNQAEGAGLSSAHAKQKKKRKLDLTD